MIMRQNRYMKLFELIYYTKYKKVQEKEDFVREMNV